MDSDVDIATGTDEMSQEVSAAYDEVMTGHALNHYDQGIEDFTYVNLDDHQPVDETLSRAFDMAHARDDAKRLDNPRSAA